jgi:signal transduction histidine kinase/ActR/RegA family two-component response regulator
MTDPQVVFRLILPEDREALTKAIERSIQEGEDFKTECRIRRPDGEVVWLQAVSSYAGVSEGEMVWNGVILDITDRKEAEDAERMSELKFRSLYSAMIDGVCLHELIRNQEGQAVDYRILDFNPAYEQLTGFDRARATGSTASELYGTVDPPYLGVFARVAETGRPVAFESHFPPLNKHFSISAFSPAPDQFATVFTDITGRKKAETDRIKLESQLRQAQKMEAVGTLAGGIAHDFNNILAAMLGYTDLALSDLTNDDPTRKCLEQVLKAGRRARGLIEQIMSFSRPEGLKFKPILLGPLVEEALELIRTTIPEGVSVRARIDPDSEPVMGDPDQIHQLLINLATNAAHAMRVMGGVMTITLEPVVLGPEDMDDLPGLEPGDYEKLTVSDTGPGIAEEDLERIFEPFFSTKKQGQGTGLGLAVVHGIVNSHGGAVRVANRLDQGTAFEIFLPSSMDTAKEVELEGGPLPKGSGRILFIDDDPSLVDSCLQTLTKLGYSTTALTSSQEGLTLFRKKPQGFDLVITDLIMPEMNGVKLAREMLSIRPDLPIILCTGFSDQITEEMARDIGFRRFLLKPLVARELARAIKDVLGSSVQKRHLRLVHAGGKSGP